VSPLPLLLPIMRRRAAGGGTPPTGMTIWWDFNQLTGFADNDEISSAADKMEDFSGNGFHGYGGSVFGVGNPQYRNTAVTINGKPVGFWNYTQSDTIVMTNSDGFNSAFATETTTMIVARRTNATPSAGSDWGFAAMGKNNGSAAFPYADGKLYCGWWSTTNVMTNVTPTGVNFADTFVLVIRSKDGQWNCRINAVEQFNTGTNTFASQNIDAGNVKIHWGHSQNSLNWYDGVFGEFILYPSFLTGSNLDQLEQYAMAKWGIS
jgi:hypothetical protein